MTKWSATKARVVLRGLVRVGWQIKRQSGSHRVLERAETGGRYVFAFKDGDELGPRMLARIAKKTGLRPEDLK